MCGYVVSESVGSAPWTTSKAVARVGGEVSERKTVAESRGKLHALIVSFETLLTPSWEARSGLHSPQLWRAGGGVGPEMESAASESTLLRENPRLDSGRRVQRGGGDQQRADRQSRRSRAPVASNCRDSRGRTRDDAWADADAEKERERGEQLTSRTRQSSRGTSRWAQSRRRQRHHRSRRTRPRVSGGKGGKEGRRVKEGSKNKREIGGEMDTTQQ